MTDCDCWGGVRRLALAEASKSLADVRAIARAKPKAARSFRAASRMGGVYCGVGMLGGGVFFSLGGL